MFSLYREKNHHSDNNKIQVEHNPVVPLKLTEKSGAAKHPGSGSAAYCTEIKSMGNSFYHRR